VLAQLTTVPGTVVAARARTAVRYSRGMSPRGLVAIVVAVAACTSKAGPAEKAPARRSFLLAPGNAASHPPVAVSLDVPPTWTVDDSDPGHTTFEVPGVKRGLVSLVALLLRGDVEERMTDAIEMQYDEDDPGFERTALPGGRVWIQSIEPGRVHARVFMPFDRGVVMGVAMLLDGSTERLPEIRAVFETVTVDAP
jgi:hypothetical protein